MELEVAAVKQDAGLCRCCHSEGCFKDLNEEYVWMDETVNYGGMLQECFNIKILQYPYSNGINGASRLICEDCAARLREACTFRKQVLGNEKKLAEMLDHMEAEDSKDQAFTIEVKTEPENIDIEEHGVTTQSYTGPAECYVKVTRKALFDKMQKQELSTFDKKLEYLKKYLLSFDDYSVEQSKAVLRRFWSLKAYFKKRWNKANRSQKLFYTKNSEWLKGTFAIPITVNYGREGTSTDLHVKSEDRNAGAAVDKLIHRSGISKSERISLSQRYLEIRRTI
ncbi:uncharacterized protein LOC134676132 isoform X2 [Cydia fagiglandana]|uniref:uncharacterized protein LOC134676132 isoform X2 n=1 Tax=Cydia fagiglandana TaxID=1458189 RepID=UPI002FEE1BB7